MLSLKNRLKKRNDFDKVYKTGRATKEDFLFLRITDNNLGLPRFGFIVSQKISKKAVARNRIKRKISEQVRLRLSKINKGVDAIITVRFNPDEEKLCQIKEILEKLFLKSGLYS